MPGQPAPTYACVGGIIIDDIVFPNGETRMAVLGGGAVHAAAGMWLWDQRPGLSACAGNDLPDSARHRLERDFDLQGVIPLDLPQARAWQLFEWDGRRTEIYRVDEIGPFVLGTRPDQFPRPYHAAQAVHILSEDTHLAGWRALLPHATLFWEPAQAFMIRANADRFRAGLRHIDIVSPNLLEARLVYGFDDPAALVRAMLDDGARVAVLRLGEDGSLAGQQGGSPIRVPAVPVPQIVDQTGAGNTYCGAFLVGWQTTGDLVQAACYGAAAASFALEVLGVADPPATLPDLRRQRFDWLMARVEPI